MVDFMKFLRKPKRVGGDGEVTVFCASEQTDVPIDLARWQLLAANVLSSEGVRGSAELSILFVERDVISEMNLLHMGKVGPTDVLAFPIDAVVTDTAAGPGGVSKGPDRAPPDPDDSPLLLGDVIVCPSVAVEQAPTHAGSLDDEIALLVTHGILHVLGYDHAEVQERQRMQSRERALLEEHHWRSSAPTIFRIDHDEDATEVAIATEGEL
jgi:probable rRNA maturation factor